MRDYNHKDQDVPVNCRFRGKVLITTHCVLTPYALRTNSTVDVEVEMVLLSGWGTSNRDVSDAAE